MPQPSEVWRVMALLVAVWTPSMMSISPELGQLGLTIQLVKGRVVSNGVERVRKGGMGTLNE